MVQASAPGRSDFSALFDGPERNVPKGARIFRPGDDSNQSLFLLRRGLVKLSTRSSKGEEITLRVYQPAEIFGEACFCRTVQRYWATALEPSTVIEASARRVREALMQSPQMGLDLVANLADRLAVAYEELQTMSSRVAVTRIAARLMTLPGIEQGHDRWIELAHRFTHEELAQIVGVRRETLTRALSRLRELGVVDYAAGRPIRVHRAGLETFLSTSDLAPDDESDR